MLPAVRGVGGGYGQKKQTKSSRVQGEIFKIFIIAKNIKYDIGGKIVFLVDFVLVYLSLSRHVSEPSSTYNLLSNDAIATPTQIKKTG